MKFDKPRLKAIASDLIITSQDANAKPEEVLMAFAMAAGNLIGIHPTPLEALNIVISQMIMSAKSNAKRNGVEFK